MSATKRSDCRYCGSTRLSKFLSLGNHPPSNSFLRAAQLASEQRYPLEVYFCHQCSLIQLLDLVSPEEIFSDYLYLSSSSRPLQEHYGKLATLLAGRFGLAAGDVAVDIGCNDGVLLNQYHLPGLITVGVEPSNVSEVARASGLNILRAFFGHQPARDIKDAYGKAKVITALNVFPHVDEIGSFVEAVSELLASDGVFVVEASYLPDVVDQTLFDTIYHEHLCYLSLTPMVPLFDRHGLEIFDVERIPFGASGPAIRVFARKRGAFQPCQSVSRLLAEEKRWGVDNFSRYQAYSRQVEILKGSVRSLLELLLAVGMRVGAYGAPAKGNTLLNYFEIGPDQIECVAETNPLKQGLLTPGSHLPIVSEEEFLKRMPDCALLLAWSYLDFFLGSSDYIKRGGRFLVPLPVPGIVPALPKRP